MLTSNGSNRPSSCLELFKPYPLTNHFKALLTTHLAGLFKIVPEGPAEMITANVLMKSFLTDEIKSLLTTIDVLLPQNKPVPDNVQSDLKNTITAISTVLKEDPSLLRDAIQTLENDMDFQGLNKALTHAVLHLLTTDSDPSVVRDYLRSNYSLQYDVVEVLSPLFADPAFDPSVASIIVRSIANDPSLSAKFIEELGHLIVRSMESEQPFPRHLQIQCDYLLSTFDHAEGDDNKKYLFRLLSSILWDMHKVSSLATSNIGHVKAAFFRWLSPMIEKYKVRIAPSIGREAILLERILRDLDYPI